MNGYGFYGGVAPGRAQEIFAEVKASKVHPRQVGKTAALKLAKEAKAQARKANPGPSDKRKHKVKVEVGFTQGTPLYEVLHVSLNELKAGFLAHIGGDGSYPDAVRRIAKFKAERQ